MLAMLAMTGHRTLEWVDKQLRDIGSRGFVVSIAYGPRGKGKNPPCGYSVLVLNTRTSEEFDVPFACRDISHAIDIVWTELRKRDWIW